MPTNSPIHANLRSVQEQQQAANEELQASNEEVQSSNEELQSINEELETSKEELESTNEELTTVNEEMAHRNQELIQTNNDLLNLQNSVHTSIVVLGRDLTVRRFTPEAEKTFNLGAADVGRSIKSIRVNFEFPELESWVADVVKTMTVHEREVCDREGYWYSLRARPYLTLDNKVDGAVLMLVDINGLKQAQQVAADASHYSEAIIEDAPPLLVLDHDLRVISSNKAFYEQFKVAADQTEGRLVYDLGNGQWNIPQLRRLLEEILPRKNFFRDYEMTHEFESIGRRTMLVRARQLDHLHLVLLFFDDISSRVEAHEKIMAAETHYRKLLETTVAQRTAKLTESIKSLESLSYTLAHDLRAPIRAMKQFSDALVEDVPLDDTGKLYAHNIVQAAERMDQLVDDLLEYGQLSHLEFPTVTLDLKAEIQNTCAQLKGELEAANAEVVLKEPLPNVCGNQTLLQQVIANLMLNAVKFVAAGARPKILLRAEPRGDMVRLWFEDNGIGIDPQYQERIFGVFQRLHSNEDFPGTGVGLAIVKRAVERMSGNVGVESERGKGSRFWIELPKGILTREIAQ